MTEYMPYLPPEGKGWKKRFEITIPLLLLILVLIVVGWKMGWLAGLPFIGGWFGGQVSNVLIVGDDQTIALELDRMKTELSLNYEVFKATDIATLRDPGYLNKYNIIILTEQAGTDATYLPSIFRGYLNSYMGGNGKLIYFGVAGSRDPADAGVNGWASMTYIQTSCARSGETNNLCDSSQSKDTHTVNMVDLRVRDTTHPMTLEFGASIPLSVAGLAYAKVNSRVTPLVYLEVTLANQTAPLSYPGIIESSSGLTGKVIYFAYHPASQPTVFKNTMSYLIG
jgi:hypothetical protein